MGDLCFLNRVYTDSDDKAKFYELVYSDIDYLYPRTEVVTFERVSDICSNGKFTTDFKIEDDYFKCCNDVKRSEYQDIVKLNSTLECFDNNSKVYSLYSLFEFGVKNNFYVADNRVIADSEWKGNGIVPFRSILFSRSSMSVYVKMFIYNELYYKHLVKVDGGVVKIDEFIFLVPEGCSFDAKQAQFVKEVIVNNVKYSAYKNLCKQLLVRVQKVTPPLINHACIMSTSTESAIKVIKTFRSAFYRELGVKTEKPIWTGGKHKGRPTSFVVFKPSSKVLGKPEELIEKIYQMCQGINKFEDVKSKILNCKWDNDLKFVALNLAYVNMISESNAELLSNLDKLVEKLELRLFYCGLFTYKLRMFSFLTNKSLVSPVSPFFFGSNLDGYTIVENRISEDD